MKRSQVNRLVDEAIQFCQTRGLIFPPFAFWGPGQWQGLGEDSQELVDNMLGWDVTDFGSGDFAKEGLVSFTFRNGNYHKQGQYPKTYAEKMLLVDDGQLLPYHFHWSKMEDIINRGGGDLILYVHNAAADDGFDSTDVKLTVDGRSVTVPAGGEVRLRPGESITLLPRQYHCWRADAPGGKVMLFEVSQTNDDFADNRFFEEKERIVAVEEDEPLRYLLFDDYKRHCKV